MYMESILKFKTQKQFKLDIIQLKIKSGIQIQLI